MTYIRRGIYDASLQFRFFKDGYSKLDRYVIGEEALFYTDCIDVVVKREDQE